MRSFSGVSISTERLSLRPLCIPDAEALFGIFSDPEFMRFWSSEPWTSVDRAVALIEDDRRALAAGEHLRLGVFLREEPRLVGTSSLFNFNEQCRRAELGYGIARDHWRKGYMFEAVSSLITFAFVELSLNRLEADIDPRNVGSARSLEKLGFRREGLLRERWIVGEEVSDSALYGLLSREWPPGGRTA